MQFDYEFYIRHIGINWDANFKKKSTSLFSIKALNKNDIICSF